MTCRTLGFVTDTTYLWLSNSFACLLGTLLDFHGHSRSDFDFDLLAVSDFDLKSFYSDLSEHNNSEV